MTLGALFTVIAIILALYRLTNPSQRKSINLFVRWWLLILGLVLSGISLVVLDALVQWHIEIPLLKFLLGIFAFFVPLVVTLLAIRSWHRAELSQTSDLNFRDFLLSCIRDGKYDEAVRILKRNQTRLPEVLSEDTLDLVYDRQFIRAMTNARTWLHLELLTDNALFKNLPDPIVAVDRTMREFLLAEPSPLRTSALLNEGGDETIWCPSEEEALITRTFRCPSWFYRSRADRPLVLSACELIDSEKLDNAYNRPDTHYSERQGISSRSKCPIFLAIKTISHALHAYYVENASVPADIDPYVSDLWDIFRTILDHSKYSEETWAQPDYREYPTPFSFLMAEILHDCKSICYDLWNPLRGQKSPLDSLAWIIKTWTFCALLPAKHTDHVSKRFWQNSIATLLDTPLKWRHTAIHVETNQEIVEQWSSLFAQTLKDVLKTSFPDLRPQVASVLSSMDRAKDYICDNTEWLRQELGLDSQ